MSREVCAHCDGWPLSRVDPADADSALVCRKCGCQFTGRDMRLIEASDRCPIGMTLERLSKET